MQLRSKQKAPALIGEEKARRIQIRKAFSIGKDLMSTVGESKGLELLWTASMMDSFTADLFEQIDSLPASYKIQVSFKASRISKMWDRIIFCGYKQKCTRN